MPASPSAEASARVFASAFSIGVPVKPTKLAAGEAELLAQVGPVGGLDGILALERVR
jgi:hypothetical protein